MENLNPETNLLADDYKRPLEYATTGQRFLNYIVDLLCFYLLMVMLVLLTMVLSDAPEAAEGTGNENLINLVALVLFVLFMGSIEGITGGKSLGKVITRTRAVYEDGGRISFSTALLRGLSRVVPFEPLSAFGGHPWHDQWTKTRVVKEESLQR